MLSNGTTRLGRRQRARNVLGTFAALFVVSCVSTQSRYIALGAKYPSRSEDCSVEIFRHGSPQKPFERISRLDYHVEKTGFVNSDFDSAQPELEKQACLSGADAIIEIHERRTSHIENRGYHVTATGIKYQK